MPETLSVHRTARAQPTCVNLPEFHMDQERERIQADLRGLLRGDVRCDDLTTNLYATDGSVHSVRPLGVICPRSLDDVVVSVQYAAENGISLHARGAGTGLAGQSLGPGLILEFSHSMRRIMHVGENTVRLQPGVVCSQLNRSLEPLGRFYGPDPMNSAVTTVGGMIAIDAAGSHRLRYGATHDTVESLQVVLASGEVVEMGVTNTPSTATSGTAADRLQHLAGQVALVIRTNDELIARHRPHTPVSCAGYRLHDVLDGNQLRLARLMAGSEGTLGLITEATLRTEERPGAVGVVVLLFDRLDSAARGALAVAELGASACDLLDRRLLSVAREIDVRYDTLLPQRTEAIMLVEFVGENAAEVWSQLQAAVTRVQRHAQLAFDARLATEETDVTFFWNLVHRVVGGIHAVPGAGRPLPFLDDVAIPVAELPDTLVQIQNLLKEHSVTASMYAHAGHGQLHLQPFLDLANPRDVQQMIPLATELFDIVTSHGGTISGEQGDGLSRSWYVRRQFGPLYRVFRQIKEIFDPNHILNPGKVVATPSAQLTDQLRPVTPDRAVLAPPDERWAARASGAAPLELQLTWPRLTVLQEAVGCNGCGECRSQLPTVRMCPIFRYAPREQASPRAKANMLRALLTGELEVAQLSQDAVKEVADLCVHCHQCRLECPAHVDIPKLMTECKSQYVTTNGLRPSDWLLAHVDRVSQWGSLLYRPANWALQNRTMRWLGERIFGLAQGRKLPRFAPRSYIRQANRRRLMHPNSGADRKVLFFVDVFANWHDVQLAEALVRILETHGVEVYVPTTQKQSGMAAVAMGATDIAKRFAQQNLPLLADAVRLGYEVVTTEPAAALCLTHEYPNLTDEEDAQLVAKNTTEACTYLWRLHQAGVLRLDFKPLPWTVGYHQPCHLRALNVGMPGYNLMRLIPELTVHLIDAGCSGMAGMYGLKHRSYRSSLRAGWGLISALRDATIEIGATECSSCKIQMEQGNSKPTVHPLKLLALAYGLMPEVESLLQTPGKPLVTT